MQLLAHLRLRAHHTSTSNSNSSGRFKCRSEEHKSMKWNEMKWKLFCDERTIRTLRLAHLLVGNNASHFQVPLSRTLALCESQRNEQNTTTNKCSEWNRYHSFCFQLLILLINRICSVPFQSIPFGFSFALLFCCLIYSQWKCLHVSGWMQSSRRLHVVSTDRQFQREYFNFRCYFIFHLHWLEKF